MIAKIAHCNSFKSCVRYVLKNSSAVLLGGHGVRLENAQIIAKDFDIQLKMNQKVKNPAGHLIISWHKLDKGRLTPEKLIGHAKEFLALTQIHDTQYIIVSHQNRPHPHLHIIFNRVNNDGKVISDSFNYQKNLQACKILSDKYHYHYSVRKSAVNRDLLQGLDRLKYELFDAINLAKSSAVSWDHFRELLEKQDISFMLRFNPNANIVQGISFKKGKMKFKGSSIDKQMSYSALNQQLRVNLLNKILNKKAPVVPSHNNNLNPIVSKIKKKKHMKLRI
jgi:hypothetical protein